MHSSRVACRPVNDLFQDNGDAVLGPITVQRDWIASSVAAGVNHGPDLDYATADDSLGASNQPNPARIASITIRGQLLGTVASGDRYGFTARSRERAKPHRAGCDAKR